MAAPFVPGRDRQGLRLASANAQNHPACLITCKASLRGDRGHSLKAAVEDEPLLCRRREEVFGLAFVASVKPAPAGRPGHCSLHDPAVPKDTGPSRRGPGRRPVPVARQRLRGLVSSFPHDLGGAVRYCRECAHDGGRGHYQDAKAGRRLITRWARPLRPSKRRCRDSSRACVMARAAGRPAEGLAADDRTAGIARDDCHRCGERAGERCVPPPPPSRRHPTRRKTRLDLEPYSRTMAWCAP